MRRVLVAAASLLAAACGPLPHASTGAALSGLRHGHVEHFYSDRDGVLLHVIVLKPPGATSPGHNGGGFGVKWAATTTSTVWRESDGSHRLDYSYRLFPTRFEVDGQRWSLDDGNVFVVKLDANWKPAVDAVPIRLTTTNHAAVLAAVQQARSADAELQSLRIVE